MTDPSREKEAASAVLAAYVAAFEARDADAIVALSAPHALIEIPMLKPNRLVGTHEIAKGQAAAFETLERIAFTLRPAAEKGDHAIAEGALHVRRSCGAEQTHTVGLVAEIHDGVLQRLSLYCDARDIRPWSDKTIL